MNDPDRGEARGGDSEGGRSHACTCDLVAMVDAAVVRGLLHDADAAAARELALAASTIAEHTAFEEAFIYPLYANDVILAPLTERLAAQHRQNLTPDEEAAHAIAERAFLT